MQSFYFLFKLCSVEYIGQKNPSNGQFYLAKNGLKLKKNIVESMSLGRMDLEIVSNEKSAMEQLKKGICAISLGSFSNSKPNQDIVFQNSEENDKGTVYILGQKALNACFAELVYTGFR